MSNLQVVQPKQSKTAALMQSGSQPVGWLAQQVALAKAYFPSCELTAETAQVYMLELAEITNKVGIEKAEAALRQACRSNRFFPSVAEIWEAAGLNTQTLLALEQDRAWRFALDYTMRWSVRKLVGVIEIEKRNCVKLVYEAGKPIPARIAYSLEQAGGNVSALEPRDRSFARQAFNEAYKRFPLSHLATLDNIDPFPPGITEKELLEGILVDEGNNQIPNGYVPERLE